MDHLFPVGPGFHPLLFAQDAITCPKKDRTVVSEASKKATAAYRKKPVKQLTMRFYPGEESMYESLKAQSNATAYLKE